MQQLSLTRSPPAQIPPNSADLGTRNARDSFHSASTDSALTPLSPLAGVNQMQLRLLGQALLAQTCLLAKGPHVGSDCLP